ncbi:MAG TPA: hypothetical protein ENJ82_04155, partial [Bacteroidetes bacterium]|nr:hypothetical protein [Bacteroidota bacterium]
MLSYPQLQLPQSWKPLFRALAENGWELSGNLPEIPDWTTRNILIFQNRNQPWLGDRFLTFLEEPIWCGNVLQPHGFSIAAV